MSKKHFVLYRDDVLLLLKKTFSHFHELHSHKARRFAALICFLWLTGVRISEALAVKREDFRISGNYLYITYVPLKHKNLVPVTLPFRLSENKKKDIIKNILIRHVITISRGERVFALNRKYVWATLKKLNKDIHPHMFRHSRASLLANKATDSQLKKWFGWTAGSKMAGRYVNLSGIVMKQIGDLIVEEEE